MTLWIRLTTCCILLFNAQELRQKWQQQQQK